MHRGGAYTDDTGKRAAALAALDEHAITLRLVASFIDEAMPEECRPVLIGIWRGWTFKAMARRWGGHWLIYEMKYLKMLHSLEAYAGHVFEAAGGACANGRRGNIRA